MNETVHQEIVKLRQELNTLGFGLADIGVSFESCNNLTNRCERFFIIRRLWLLMPLFPGEFKKLSLNNYLR